VDFAITPPITAPLTVITILKNAIEKNPKRADRNPKNLAVTKYVLDIPEVKARDKVPFSISLRNADTDVKTTKNIAPSNIADNPASRAIASLSPNL
jgi:hypothetical protein